MGLTCFIQRIHYLTYFNQHKPVFSEQKNGFSQSTHQGAANKAEVQTIHPWNRANLTVNLKGTEHLFWIFLALFWGYLK